MIDVNKILKKNGVSPLFIGPPLKLAITEIINEVLELASVEAKAYIGGKRDDEDEVIIEKDSILQIANQVII